MGDGVVHRNAEAVRKSVKEIGDIISCRGEFAKFTAVEQVSALSERLAGLKRAGAPEEVLMSAERLVEAYARVAQPMNEDVVRAELWKGKPDPGLKVLIHRVEKAPLGEAGMFNESLRVPVRDAAALKDVEAHLARELKALGVEHGTEGWGQGLWMFAREHGIPAERKVAQRKENVKFSVGEVRCEMTKEHGRQWWSTVIEMPRKAPLLAEEGVGEAKSIRVELGGISGKVGEATIDVGRALVIFPVNGGALGNLREVAVAEMLKEAHYAGFRAAKRKELAGLGLAEADLARALDDSVAAEWLANNRLMYTVRHEDGHRIYSMLSKDEKAEFKKFAWELLLNGHEPADAELKEVAESKYYSTQQGSWWSKAGASDKYYNEAFARLYARWRAGEFEEGESAWKKDGVTHHPLQLALIAMVGGEKEELAKRFLLRTPERPLPPEKRAVLREYFSELFSGRGKPFGIILKRAK